MFMLSVVCAGSLVTVAAREKAVPVAPKVEAEEDVYRYEAPNNGAGPMWCHGSTCLVRIGDRIFASGMETLREVKPLNNTRWLLFARDTGSWRLIHRDEKGRTREPSPLAGFPDGRLFLSVNPTLTEPNAYSGAAQPQILQFRASRPAEAFASILPHWAGDPQFTEHSYRSFAADGANRELILFQNIGYTHAEWAFYDRHAKWSASGKLVWPWGAEYDKPQPIRVCYPNVALHNRAVYFCGVSDIVEPYAAWREFKRKLTGQEWDYDFRRLFFTWCPDIRAGKFHNWLEVASRDRTCGWIFPCDLWAAPDGAVHILWTERAIDERLREKFFPGEKQRYSLQYAIIREGRVALRRTLAEGGEGLPGEVPGNGRFQITRDQRLFVFYYVGGTDEAGKAISENRVLEIRNGASTPPVRVPLAHPFSSFFTATPRAGSPPSHTLELLGECPDLPGVVRYARIRLLDR